MFDKLAAKQIKPNSVQNLVALSKGKYFVLYISRFFYFKALTSGDYQTSNGIIMSMLTTDDVNWVLGIKRLVDMFIQIKSQLQ